MNQKNRITMAALFSLLAALLLGGCGSDNKEGGTQGGAAIYGGVATVSETACSSCHSSTVDPLTGEPVYGDGSNGYINSVHQRGYGCQGCHGGGAGHNGVGPLPFPDPSLSSGGPSHCAFCHTDSTIVTNVDTSIAKFVDSRHALGDLETSQTCNRCHTHQGAILADNSGYTGDKNFLAANLNIAPGAIADADAKHIKCNTCHVSHRPENLRTVNGWDPSGAVGSAVPTGNAQYKLCTSCHTYINPNGTLVATASGGTTTAAFEHDTSWYRIIATTHYNSAAATGDPITGYGVRTTGEDPCFDCHGHESKTNTGNLTRNAAGKYVLNTSVVPTIYTDWAKSGHAGGLLTAKYAAQEAYPKKSDGTYDRSVGMTNAVMAASVDPGVWNEHNSTGCNRCHNASGFVGILADPTGASQPTTAVGQVLTCWGCHSNASNGILRTLAGTNANTDYTNNYPGWNPIGYALNYGKLRFPDLKGSNLCITCHDGRSGDPGSVTASTTPQGAHYLPAAAVMYVKMGFIGFDTDPTYQNSLKADLDGGTITSTHRKLGTPAIVGDSHNPAFFVAGNLDSNGPCAACHLTGSHSLAIDQKAIDSVCSKCHDSEGGHSLATVAAFNQYFLEPQSEVFQDAIKLAVDVFNSSQSIITIAADDDGIYRRYYQFGTTTTATLANWTAVATALGLDQTKLVGAVSNITMFSKDKGAFAHARTYSRRLLYDSIDYLDGGGLNLSVSATALARSAVSGSLVAGLYGKGASAYTDATLTTLAPGTTEAMVYLIKWSRSTGAWSTPERP